MRNGSCIAAICLALALPRAAAGFAVHDGSGSAVSEYAASAARWSAQPDPLHGRGLHDGISVAIDPDLDDLLGLSTPEDLILFRETMEAAFRAWQSPVLRFDLHFDGEVTRNFGRPDDGMEIDVIGAAANEMPFAWAPGYGYTDWTTRFLSNRTLTNGSLSPGWTILGADIYLNYEALRAFEVLIFPHQRGPAVQRLLMHEIGHALGFAHPNDTYAINLDCDSDPYNVLVVDPADPYSCLVVSPNIDRSAVMTVRPQPGAAYFFTSLRNDDRAGRDVLYPVPEPATALGVAAGIAMLAALRRGRYDRSARRAQ
jgi:hypothetical protein